MSYGERERERERERKDGKLNLELVARSHDGIANLVKAMGCHILFLEMLIALYMMI